MHPLEVGALRPSPAAVFAPCWMKMRSRKAATSCGAPPPPAAAAFMRIGRRPQAGRRGRRRR